MFTLNLLLFLFNLLPLPPMDGSAAIQLLMKDEIARRYQELMRQPMIALLGIMVAWRVIGRLFWPLLTLALRFLYPGISYG